MFSLAVKVHVSISRGFYFGFHITQSRSLSKLFKAFRQYNHFSMKLSLLSSSLTLLLQLASGAPTPTSDEAIVQERANIVKRATVTDIATTGYATQNGGTTGGKGGTVTTVSTLAQFTTAVTNGTWALKSRFEC